MFYKIPNNLIVCLMISQQLHIKFAQTSEHGVITPVGRFDFSQNGFEMRRAKIESKDL